MAVMTNTLFVEKLKDIASNYKTLYVKGCFGAPLNASNKQRYINQYSYNANRATMINAASVDTFGFDCVCLLKGVLWGWNGNKNDVYGGAKYASNGVPDCTEEAMINACSGVSTDFTNIEVGEVVYMTGHIGVYIGNGQCVECTPSWTNNVQYSYLGNKPEYKKGNYRIWLKHGKLPYITYEKAANNSGSTSTGNTSTTLKFKVNDIVNFTGNTHYASANAASGTKVSASKAKITVVSASGKHPYHVRAVNDSGAFISGVYGWVDANTLSAISASSTPTTPSNTDKIEVGDLVKITGTKYYNGVTIPASIILKNWYVLSVSGDRAVIDKSEDGKSSIQSPVKTSDLQLVKKASSNSSSNNTWTPAVGDIVNFTGTKHYASSDAASGYTCKPGKAKIKSIYKLGTSKHPYLLEKVSGSTSTVEGWVDAGTFTKA